MADMARVCNLLASALTARAGLLHREKPLLHTDLTMTTAGRTVNRFSTGRSTTAIAVFTGNSSRDTDLNRGAPDSSLKIKFEIVAKISALTHMTAPATATTAASEYIAEDVTKNVTEISSAGAGLAFHAGVPELIIATALFLIRKHFESLIGFFEFFFRFGVIRIPIRVIFHGHATVSLLDVGFRGATINTQYFVVIPLRHIARYAAR